MTAVSTMILNSLVMTGEKSIGSSLDSNEQPYYLSRLNSMMDSWSNERLFMYSLQQTSFPLTTSDGTYSIGPGGDFNMTRPTRIVDPCFIRDTDSTDTPLELIDADTYGRIIDKTMGDVTPCYLFYDYAYSATSTATIKLYPLPDAGLTLFINTLQPLQTFSTVSVNLQLPPGYQRAIETNFAIEIAPGFISVSPEVAKIAKESKAAIKTTNLTAPILKLDYGVASGMMSNILTGP